jgi:hypothetical protein
MNVALMEELLNEEESSTLDFKRDQYPFDKQSDDVKSELLKDILAFANAWRRTDAYIVIGVDDVKGGRSKVVGVSSQLDDARIQQFVNSKSNRPIIFSYEAFPFEGVQLGVIQVPVQDRPIYLKSDYGKLRRDTVYIRRNSSTDIAGPDEIAKMGSVSIRDVLGDLVASTKVNPVIEALRRDQSEENVVLIEWMRHTFDRQRWQCKVSEVNELYAVFESVGSEQPVSGSISQITVSYEPTMNMRLYTVRYG